MKKKKNKVFPVILTVLFVLVLLGAGAYMAYTFKLDADELKVVNEQLQTTMRANTKVTYVAKTDISKGEILTEDNLSLETALNAFNDSYFITEDDLGKIAVTNIVAGSPVLANMVSSATVTKDLRENEIGIVKLMFNQMPNDFVDLRIRFANGQEYTVLSKIRVKFTDIENSIFYADLNEGQMMTLASATVDAYMNSGTKLFLVKYVEANLQDASEVTYPVSDAVRTAIANDPNIVTIAEKSLSATARREMQQYLSTLTEDQLKAVVEGEQMSDTAHNSALAAIDAANALNAPEEE